jgi:hypothetical protein
MDRKIEDVYFEMYKGDVCKTTKYLILEIAGDIGEAAALTPMVQYNYC